MVKTIKISSSEPKKLLINVTVAYADIQWLGHSGVWVHVGIIFFLKLDKYFLMRFISTEDPFNPYSNLIL